MKRNIFLAAFFIIIVFLVYTNLSVKPLLTPRVKQNLWQIRSIDTVKYSRDVAREKEKDLEFDKVIEIQVANIAKTGANYIAIGTPYDSEFKPFLNRWVAAARHYNLKVWFRGNFSGWEGWFNYPKIDRAQHLKQTEEFIVNNSDLFEDGDIFTSCSECENGGPGDPRQTRDIDGYRQFLISEYNTSKTAFAKINKKVATGYFSMNGDIARLIMDSTTTKATGGVVVIDHYVATPEKLVGDVKELIKSSGGQLFLGELGVPIPDITGSMTEDEQANWIKKALTDLPYQGDLIGLNYWVSVGGSTQLWDENNHPRKVVDVLKQFYSQKI